MEYAIGGTKISFPFKPYPSQLAMMSKIIKSLEDKKNALIESPTGSGKSLALLCASLAWQKSFLIKAYSSCTGRRPAGTTGLCGCLCHRDQAELPDNLLPEADIFRKQTSGKVSASKRYDAAQSNPSAFADLPLGQSGIASSLGAVGKANTGRAKKGVLYEDEEDFVARETSSNHPEASDGDRVSKAYHAQQFGGHCEDCADSHDVDSPPRIPRIFFGSRTHKQLAQITKELKKTSYCDVPMTVLSSREYSCVHPDISRKPNKHELCKDLIDPRRGAGCIYHSGVSKVKSQNQLVQHQKFQNGWDIEDLVTLGRRIHACPYFVTRELMAESLLILCPYNYLVDPMIREAMSIQLTGQIVILDEAHNMEDCSRDAASLTVSMEILNGCLQDLDNTAKMASIFMSNASMISTLRSFLSSFQRLIESHDSKLSNVAFGKSVHIWGTNQTSKLIHRDLGLSNEAYSVYNTAFIAVSDKQRPNDRDGRDATPDACKLKAATLSVVEGLLRIVRFMLQDNCRHMKDYRVALVRNRVYARQSRRDSSGFMTSLKGVNYEDSINFWCMNPGVVFQPIDQLARSILLTSGTLAPMGCFASELEVEFPIQLEANHVIADCQVLVEAVGVGVSGHQLLANYQNSESFAFQDEVGETVTAICRAMPNGVLFFLPSYNMLDKLLERWRNTGLLNRLEDVKPVFVEPRASSRAEFDTTIRDYSERTHDGALLMAVCRGKVSEGIDFPDEMARCVITLGIPFPNVKDAQVDLKKQYNNSYSSAKNLVSGNEWYETQAFRAINQALGRCIRHEHDWGALVLLDERFCRPRFVNLLSRWIRKRLLFYNNCSVALQDLVGFVESRESSANSQASTCVPLATTPSLERSFVSILRGTPFGRDESDAETARRTCVADGRNATDSLSPTPNAHHQTSILGFVNRAPIAGSAASNSRPGSRERSDVPHIDPTSPTKLTNEFAAPTVGRGGTAKLFAKNCSHLLGLNVPERSRNQLAIGSPIERPVDSKPMQYTSVAAKITEPKPNPYPAFSTPCIVAKNAAFTPVMNSKSINCSSPLSSRLRSRGSRGDSNGRSRFLKSTVSDDSNDNDRKSALTSSVGADKENGAVGDRLSPLLYDDDEMDENGAILPTQPYVGKRGTGTSGDDSLAVVATQAFTDVVHICESATSDILTDITKNLLMAGASVRTNMTDDYGCEPVACPASTTAGGVRIAVDAVSEPVGPHIGNDAASTEANRVVEATDDLDVMNGVDRNSLNRPRKRRLRRKLVNSSKRSLKCTYKSDGPGK